MPHTTIFVLFYLHNTPKGLKNEAINSAGTTKGGLLSSVSAFYSLWPSQC